MQQRNHNPKNKEDYWMFKAPLELKMKLDLIRIERIKQGRDTEMTPYNRLGLAMSRHKTMIQDLLIADLPKEKKVKEMKK